ncbi:HAMP domain-containing methyl-accepting chemotaxis protein [Rhodobacter sp. Har01]|uniref:methyl-accepting chemotaxis protein n=1 Tax=Rhodobacter sp. Har01 TaxID=2883999 RepID=UPI001D091D18|nr:HAMP domain-containing methyl-accepting chemotaxis protein [Rhodobacter sp. Har01]MCB6180184.1 HAMP domain-containing methyl-accepting chemotaxis protein [Rhodobacter sp. Har01]
MIRLFKNLPLLAQGAFGAVVTAAALMAVVVMALLQLGAASTRMEEVGSTVLPETQRAADLVSTTVAMQFELLQLVTWASSGVGGDSLQRQFDEAIAAQEAFRAAVAEIDVDSSARISEFGEVYFAQAKQVLDVAEVDASLAMMFLNGAEEGFATLNAAVRELGRSANATAMDRVGAMAASARLSVTEFTPISIAAVIGGLVLTLLVQIFISRPVRQITGAMKAVTEGLFDAPIPCLGLKNELGQLAAGVASYRDHRQHEVSTMAREREEARVHRAALVDQLGEGLRRLSAGDLTGRIDDDLGEGFNGLRDDYNATIDGLGDLMGSVLEASATIRARAEEIAGSSDELARRTENQAATLEQTAAALDELTASVRSAAEGASEVESVAREARGRAEDSGKVVQDAIGAMSEIKSSSEGISKIIGVIDDIAFQTNLLALNAGVEAARAGDAGRGFAVVASEVRALAQRSSEAAKEIKGLIGTSSDQVASGVALVNRTGDALTDIVVRVNNIAGLISEITTGAKEQSAGLGEINVGVTELDKVTQQNTAMVENATAASATLRHEAETLQGLVAQFRLHGGVTRGSAAVVPLRPPEPEANTAEIVPDPGRKLRAGQGGWAEF